MFRHIIFWYSLRYGNIFYNKLKFYYNFIIIIICNSHNWDMATRVLSLSRASIILCETIKLRNYVRKRVTNKPNELIRQCRGNESTNISAYIFEKKNICTHCRASVARDPFRRSNSEPAAVSFDPVTRSAWVARGTWRGTRGDAGRTGGRVVSLLSMKDGIDICLSYQPNQPPLQPLQRPPPSAAHLLVRADGRPTDQPADRWGLEEVEEIKA